MPKFEVFYITRMSKHIGTYEAATEDEAIDLAAKDDGHKGAGNPCYHCTRNLGDLEDGEFVAAEEPAAPGATASTIVKYVDLREEDMFEQLEQMLYDVAPRAVMDFRASPSFWSTRGSYRERIFRRFGEYGIKYYDVMGLLPTSQRWEKLASAPLAVAKMLETLTPRELAGPLIFLVCGQDHLNAVSFAVSHAGLSR